LPDRYGKAWGVIALWGRIVSFIGAGLLIILSVLGFVHARWIGPATEVLAAHLKKVNAHLKTCVPQM
jgi:hypothetical protein